jgi:hypothetical protein
MRPFEVRSQRNIRIVPRAADYDEQLAALRREKGLSAPVSASSNEEFPSTPAESLPELPPPAAESLSEENPMSRELTRECAECEGTFTVRSSGGRPPSRCPKCRGAKKPSTPKAKAVSPVADPPVTLYRRRLEEVERAAETLELEANALRQLIELVES